MDVVIEDLLARFQNDRGLNHLKREQLFETFAAYCVLGQFYEDDFDADQVRTGSSGDRSIDAAAVVIDGTLYTEADDVEAHLAKSGSPRVHFVVIQAKLEDSFKADEYARISADLLDVFGQAKPALPANARIRNYRRCIEAVYTDKEKLSERPQLTVWYACCGKLDPAILGPRQQAAENQLRGLNRFGKIQVRAVGAAGLHELFKRESEAITATVTMPHSKELPLMPGVTQSFVGVMQARELVDKILKDPVGDIRAGLFHDNVRAFQGYGTDSSGNKAGVNAEIRATIRDTQTRGDFAVLNNGITIVARKLNAYDDTFTLGDFQIVNGCQTCYVLYDEQDQLDSDVYVAARIISTSDKELISRIVAATNRQNNMTKDAITVLDKIHRDIEAHFEAYPESRRLYYERRPKQFASQKIEKTRILSRQQLTKAYAAMFLEEAHRVSRLSELVASRGEDLFRESHDPLEYYAAASTYYRVEWLFRNQRLASTYGPLRYHLMALVKAYILGPDKLPVGVQKRKAACERILAVVWDAEKATDLVKQLVDPAQAAAKAEGFPDVSLTEVVRKPHFRLSALNAVLQLARAATP